MVCSSNDSFSLGQRQEMSNQLTIRQEERDCAVTERWWTKREGDAVNVRFWTGIYMKNVCEEYVSYSFVVHQKGNMFSMNCVIYYCCPAVWNRAQSAQLQWEEWITLNRGIKEDKLMLTLGCNDSNCLPLCGSIRSHPHNKWMEMRGNKRMRWNHFHWHYIFIFISFPSPFLNAVLCR